MASPSASIADASRKFPLSLTRFAAAGSGLIGSVFCPRALKSGMHASIAPGSPAATMNSLAAAAASGRPKTGAAMKRCPASACAWVSSRASATLTVLIETWIAPLGRLLMMPLSARATLESAASSASMVMTASPRHASAMRAASCAPSSTSFRRFSGLRLKTVTWCPALTRFAAMAEPMCPSLMNPIFIPSLLLICLSRSLQGSHELGSDGIRHGFAQDAINFRPGRGIQRPAGDVLRLVQLIGPARAPQRDAHSLIEHPADGQVNHAPLELLPGELVELLHGREVLREAGRLELRVHSSQIIALEFGIDAHPAAQQSAAQRSISERCDAVPAAVGKNLRFDRSFEEIVRGLQHVQRRDGAESLHLRDREIADADGPDLSLLIQRSHHVCRFLHRRQRVRPVDLVDVRSEERRVGK